MTLNRRDFLKQGGLTLSFAMAGSSVLMTPAQAHVRAVPYAVLKADEVALLEAVCEILLPGAIEEGVAHFVDQQLTVDPNDSLLVLKYFGYPPPYVDFYRPALMECQKFSQRMFKKDIAQLSDKESHSFIEAIRDGKAEGWNGPPPPLVYHAMRNDAVDVVYGTVKGFEKLGIPYMAHILPPEGF